MMNRSMQVNQSAALTLCSASAWSTFAFYAAGFFGGLFFYFYYFFTFLLPSERKLVW